MKLINVKYNGYEDVTLECPGYFGIVKPDDIIKLPENIFLNELKEKIVKCTKNKKLWTLVKDEEKKE